MAPSWPSDDPSARPPRLSIRALRTLPARLCSPPPAVGKARSFGVTPLYQVNLEDVLENKLLPPLSLRDFEQHLLFVRGDVEYLYFALWLKEYTRRYDEWCSDAKYRFNSCFRGRPATSPRSPALASFFSKAQHTFLIPGSEYALDAPPDMLAPLASCDNKQGVWTSRHGPHPDPVVFTELRLIANSRLKVTLDHCVIAAYTNVGNGRAQCGLVAGALMILAGTIAPLTLNFLRHANRWGRLAALPGFVIGLTVILAAWHGVCIMIWIFGDFRQLRKFEMVEKVESPFSEFGFPDLASTHTDGPIVTPPQAVTRATKIVTASRFCPSLPPIRQVDDTPTLPDLVRAESIFSLASPITPVRPSFPSDIPSIQVRVHSPCLGPTRSLSPISFNYTIGNTPSALCDKQSICSSINSDDSDSTEWSGEEPAIEVSEAYYDELLEPITGSNAIPRSIAIPLSASATHGPHHGVNNNSSLGNSHLPSFGSGHQYQTASFIRPFTYGSSADLEHGASHQCEGQLPFDFDGLPRRTGVWNDASRETKRSSAPDSTMSGIIGHDNLASARRNSSTSIIAPSVASSYWPAVDLSVFSRHEDTISIADAPIPSPDGSDARPPIAAGNVKSRTFGPAPPDQVIPALRRENEASLISARMREMLSVPAFRSPLTLVLNPIVSRAQWDIVVRSAMAATTVGLLAEIMLVAIPVSP